MLEHPKALALVAIAAIVLVLGAHVRWIDEPFDASLGGVTSGEYYGYAAKAFDRHGFLALKGQPATVYFERTTAVFFGYANHPPTPHLITYPAWKFLGRDERALRLPLLLVFALSMLGMGLLGRAAGLSGFVAAATFATLPLLVEYGNMVDAPMFSLLLLVFGTLAYLRWRSTPTARTRLCFVALALLGALTDWFGYFLAVGVCVDLIFERPRAAPFRSSVAWSIAPWFVGFGLFLGWLTWTSGGGLGLTTKLRQLMNASVGAESPYRIEDMQAAWSEAMPRFIATGFGIPLAILAAVCFLAALGRVVSGKGASTAARAVVILTIAGAMPSIVFHSRAARHEFWILPLASAVALSFVWTMHGVAALIRGAIGGRTATLVTAALIAATVGIDFGRGVDLHRHYRTDSAKLRGESLNTFLAKDDVILMPDFEGAVRYYCHATMIAPVGHSAENVKFVIRTIAPARDSIGRIFIAVPTHLLGSSGWTLELPIVPPFKELPYGPNMRVALAALDPTRLYDWAK